MPGLTFSNELISHGRGEGMHMDFTCLLFSHWHLKRRPHPHHTCHPAGRYGGHQNWTGVLNQ